MKPTTSELASSQWGRGERYIQHLRRERIKNWATTIAVGLAIAFFLWVFAPKAHGADAFTRPSESVRAGFLKLQPDQQNDMLPPVVPVVPVTNTFWISLAWDNDNLPGVVDHFRIIVHPLKGGPDRTMTASGLTNNILGLSPTNIYRMWVVAVAPGGNESELSESIDWPAPIVSAALVAVVAGPPAGPFLPVPGYTFVAAPGFYQTFANSNQFALARANTMTGNWMTVEIPIAKALAPIAQPPGTVYRTAIWSTNNISNILALQHKE